ncbi:MAG TPA: alpha-2-macroglobulin family protein [Pyrinomonadaceae bacterium]|nr:alpha-2-macroglobulin family protein [Pyrinomonadaceae bacterium]
MKILIASLLFVVSSLVIVHAQQPPDYAQLKAEAERLYREASYARAHELYEKASALKLPDGEARWLQFRLADTAWRAQAATETADSTRYDRARQQLDDLVRERVEDAGEHDVVWAEAHQSLGDFWWARRDSHDWGMAWPHYQQALEWWAGAREVEAARARYLKIIRAVSSPAYADSNYYYSYYGNVLPVEILENALKVATTDDDKAYAHYLLAMTLRTQGEMEERRRAPEEFEAALAPGKASDWYDDALYFYAEWLTGTGMPRQLENGEWVQEQDYARALELFRRLLKEYRKGETRFYDQAAQQIENIKRPTVSVNTTNIYLPGSEVQAYLSWRNVRRIDFALYRIDLPRDVNFADKHQNGGMWIQQIRTAGREKVKAWSKETGDKGDYKPGQETMRLDGRLPPGAYLLEATGDAGAQARDVVLVTDATLVLKTSGRRALAYFCHAVTGAPLAGASVKFWQKVYENQDWTWREQAGTTNEDGLARFDLAANTQSYSEIFASASGDGRQAFSVGNSPYYQPNNVPWRIYAFTDRPAYRPHETAQWKFIARKYGAGVYSTPAHQVLEFQITDPRGTKITEGKTTLNAFGSAWGSLELTETMPLGEYRVEFWDEGRRNGIGNAILFRMEEYKLPEFKVSVSAPEENGRKKAFRLGDKVEVKIHADYYFGGPVAKGTVEVLVYQNPFYHSWTRTRDYPWYYEDAAQGRSNYGGGQIVKREKLKIAPDGTATLRFDTPRYAQQDFEYRIVARVTDASRREVVADETVRVTRQRYYVYPRALHNIYRPQDKVEIETKVLDANNQPVVAEGRIKVTRDYWYEIWIDPKGREVKGDELRRLRERHKDSPDAPQQKGWRLKFRGYEHEDVTEAAVGTNAEGTAAFSFTPAREGYYHVEWSSRDGASQIKADTYVWVATNATSDLGYRYGGLQLIVDSDTFNAGQTSPVMIVAPTDGAYVLFSVEGEDLDSYQLIRMTGTAKLVELPIEEKHVPNIFLSAAMVRDTQLFVDTKQVVVPPVNQFLNVEVKADREQYQPREEGLLTITTRDRNGRPVAAEIALGLIDESVFYIQQDIAGDPRQFYYGTKRSQFVQTMSTFQQKSYVKLVADTGQQLVNAREEESRKFKNARDEDSPYARSQMMVDGVQNSPGAVMETVTVTSSDASGEFRVSKDDAVNGRRVSNLALMKAGVVPAPVQAQPESAVQVRNDFRSTMFWQPDVLTDGQGVAQVKVKYPDSLTGWQATARVATAGNQFGIGQSHTRTKQPLIVRLQAPRFFLVGDSVTVSAVINNNTEQAMRARPELSAEGLSVSGRLVDGKLDAGAPAEIEVKANGEARVDWLVSVERAGDAKLRAVARGGQYSDATENNFTVYEHGIEKFVSRSGKLRTDEADIRLEIPAARKRESTEMTVQIAPSMAVTMLDALPYLIDYPYGCTEQTMSRFLPAAVTAKTLKDLGLSPEAAMGRVFGGVEPGSAAATHPEGKRSLKQLDDITKQSLERLYSMQHEDGGWGWWKTDESDHFMTAYVVWGMVLARKADVAVRSEVLENAAEYLDKEIVEEEGNLDRQAWLLHALAAYQSSEREDETDDVEISEFQTKAFNNLWENRDKLNAYTRALLALSAHYYGYQDKAQTLVRNLENGVKIDRAPDTSVVQRGAQSSDPNVIANAHWGEDGFYYRWSDGGVEATSFALRALVAIDPKNKLVEPVTNWLVKNRRGTQWSNTRDTAITVLALNDYLRASGETKPDLEYEVLVNGQLFITRRLTAADALSAPSRFAVPRELVRDGANDIRIRRRAGTSPLYFAAQAQFFSLEEPIKAAGNEIFVRREYFKLVGRPTLLKGYVYDRVPLADGEAVASGERIEVVVTVEAKNNYEYLLFEDLKPAGFEAVEVRSGESVSARELKAGAIERKFGAGGGRRSPQVSVSVAADSENLNGVNYTGRASYVYQELRDRKVALFVDSLSEGVWEIRYDLRAEAPGSFHALPMLGHAMYVPEIRCNDEEMKVRVLDQR